MSKMYTVKQAADRLGVSPKTIALWVRQNMFPNAYKLNPNALTSPLRIPEQDIVAIEEKRHGQMASQ